MPSSIKPSHKEPCKVSEPDQLVQQTPPKDEASDNYDSKVLFKLNKEENGDMFIDLEDETQDKLWLVVRAMKNETEKLSYELKKNDIIKLGRIQFRVKDIQTDSIAKNDPYSMLHNDDIEEVGSVITSNETNQDTEDGSNMPQCRFCWENDCSKERPLINACK